MNTDLPYLNPLVLFLKKSEELKKHFSERSFFLDANIDVNAINEAIGTNGPRRNIIWIFPGDTRAQNQDDLKRLDCSYKGTHTFYVTILNVCDRDKFTLSKTDSGLELTGPVIDTVAIRKSVKDEIRNFSIESRKPSASPRYFNLRWVKDNMIEFTKNEKGCGFLNATLEFEIELI